jgi:hypothetical protein
VTALLRRAVELGQERLALSIDDMVGRGDECAGTYREGNRAAGDGMIARSLAQGPCAGSGCSADHPNKGWWRPPRRAGATQYGRFKGQPGSRR